MTEIVIAGGGLAGAAAACLLARAGRPVLLAEREARAADKICGEFISGEAKHYLDRLGVDLLALGAQRISHLRLVHSDKSAAVALPFAGYGLSRRLLDETLLCRAAEFGADIRRGDSLRLRREGESVVMELPSAGTLTPKTLFLATGKHDLRAVRRPQRRATDAVGFKQHFHLAPAQISELAGCVELILLPDGYAGLQLVEGERANLCLLVSRERLRRVGGCWQGLLHDLRQTEPHLARRLAGASAAAPALSIYRVPYGYVHEPGAGDPANMIRIGDQMGVIPSFTGDGMAIALHTACAAAAAYMGGADAATIHRALRRDIKGQIGRATLMSQFLRGRVGRAGIVQIAGCWPACVRLAGLLTRSRVERLT